MAGHRSSLGDAGKEFDELQRMMYQLRCEVTRAEDGKLYSEVAYKLDRICADIQTVRRSGKDPWKTVQDAKQKVGVIQKEVLGIKGSHVTSSHGSEAGTQKEVVGSVLPKK
jgi:hypothetical protein